MMKVKCFVSQALRPPPTCTRSYTSMFWGPRNLRTCCAPSFLTTPNGWVELRYVWKLLFLLLKMKTNDWWRLHVLIDIQAGFNDCMYIAGIRWWTLRAAVYQGRLWSGQQTVVLWPSDHSSGYYRYLTLVFSVCPNCTCSAFSLCRTKIILLCVGLLPWVKLIDNFDAEYEYVTNEGTLFTFKTNLDAPRYRLINIDFASPAQSNWKELIPQHDKDVIGELLQHSCDLYY